MAIAFDANSRGNNNAFHTSLTWSHTCTGSNLVLIVGTSVESDSAPNTAQTVSGITYNGVALTKIISKYITGNTDNGCELWYLIAPSTGANNVVVTYTGQVDGSFGGALSFTGVDQSNPVDTSGSNETLVGTSVAKAITTGVTDAMLVSICHAGNSINTMTVDGSQTQVYSEGVTGDCYAGMSYRLVTTATSYTTTWTLIANDDMALSVVSLKPLVASVTVKTLASLGVG